MAGSFFVRVDMTLNKIDKDFIYDSLQIIV